MSKGLSKSAAPYLLLALFFVLGFLPRLFAPAGAGNGLAIHFLDVGQGDAALVRAPDGRNILIDGGPGQAVLGALSGALPWWDREIDLMVLSHPHDDHVAGLVPVLERYRVRRAVYTGAEHTGPEYLAWLSALRDGQVPLTIVDRPQDLDLGEGLRLEFLWPREALAGADGIDLNNSSIVIRLVYGDTACLFTGDIEKETETALLISGAELAADVLKVPHHGSGTSLAPDFLTAVNPAYAVISVGTGNRYGHPDSGTIDRLEALGAVIFRTDRDRTVHFESDGQNLLFNR